MQKATRLRKGTPIPRGTVTAQLNANPARVANSDRIDAEIDIMDWLGGARSIRATEQVVGLGKYGKTLTVLTCPSVQDETYQEEEDGDDNERLSSRSMASSNRNTRTQKRR